MEINTLTEDLSLLEAIYQFEDETIPIYENVARSRYYAVVEGDSTFVTEGLSDMVHSFAEAIAKFIKAIKEFFLKFFRMFTSFSLNLQDFVKKYGEELRNVDCDFEITGYNFTVMGSKDPDMSDFNKLVSTYNSALSNLKGTTKADIAKEGTEFLSEQNLAEMRARVLGVSGGIPKDDFVETVRKHYRGGEKDATKIQITNKEVVKIVDTANEMVALKKKAENDRDNIIQLLSKAEVFFNRKVGLVYKDGKAKVGAKTFDVEDTSVKYGDTDIAYNESDLAKVTALASVKYNETKAVSGIINIVVTERANAFRDLVKQSRQIVGKALAAPKKKLEKKDSDVGEATNYADMGEQVSYVLHESLIAESKATIDKEFQFLMESIQSGEVASPTMEAGARDIAKKVKDTVITVIQNIMHQYRQKAIAQIQKYEPWYTNQDVIANCSTGAEKKELQLMPLWDGIYGTKAMSQIQSCFREAVAKTTDHNGCRWANDFVNAKTVSELKEIKDLNAQLKNYFRYGKKGLEEMKPVNLTGKRLSNIVEGMFDYLGNYDTISKGSDTLGNAAKNLKAPTMESVDPNYIGLIGSSIFESDFFVFEEAPGGIGGNAGLGDGAKAASQTRAAAPNKEAQAAGEKATQKPNQVIDKTKEEADASTGEDKNKNTSMTDYYNTSIDFCKKVALAYVTVLEERFLLYYRTCEACAGDDYKPSKFIKEEKGTTGGNVTEPQEKK